MKKKLISIIIPYYNSEKTINLLIESIVSNKFNNYEILIVDDHSDNELILKKEKGKIFRLEKRKGPAYARNYGAKVAKGDILLFLDSDVVLQENCLHRILKHFKERKNIIIQGKYTPLNNEKNIFSRYKNYYSDFKFNKPNTRLINSISSFCFAISKKNYEKLNGFNENYSYKHGAEDIDFSIKAINRNIKILLDKKIQVEHLKTYTIYSFFVSEHIKIKSNFKIFLRNFKNRNSKIKIINYPLSKNKLEDMKEILISILLSPLILFFSLAILYSLKMLIPLCFMTILFLILNYKLVVYFLKDKLLNIPFLILIHFLHMLNTFISIIVAAIEYIFMSRY